MGIVSKYVERLRCRDPTLDVINLFDKQLANAELVELADCLLAHPDIVKSIYLAFNRLTDETGVKLARYVAASSTIEFLNLTYNQFSEATYLAVAAALRVNSSMRVLLFNDNQAVVRKSVDAAFVDVLRLNPVHPAWSAWHLYSLREFSDADFKRLKDAAEKSTPPSMLEFLLCVHLDAEKTKIKIH
ncbi:MAG: hypothetical protein ACOVQN_08945 [Exiguobacterium sp.]